MRDLYREHALKVNPDGDRTVLERNALMVAKHQVGSNVRGIDSHGVPMSRFYIKRIKNGTMDAFAEPTCREDGHGNAVIFGNDALGAVIGELGVSTALRLAREHKSARVYFVSGLNHMGRVGTYVEEIARQGPYRAHFVCTGDPWVKHLSGTDVYTGTNPIAVGQPVGFEWVYLLDFATTSTAKNKIRYYAATKQPLPPGWALDGQGKDTTDPDKALEPGATLTPLGWPASWVKGFFLSLDINVEVLAGGNRAWGPDVVAGGTWELDANFGAVLEVRDIRAAYELCGSSYDEYLSTMRANIEHYFKANNTDKFPGKIEYEQWKRSRDGLGIPDATVEMLAALGAEVGLALEDRIMAR